VCPGAFGLREDHRAPGHRRPDPARRRRGADRRPAGRLVIVGNRPQVVFVADPTFRVDPGLMLRKMLEIHGSRYVSLAEMAQTLEVLRQRQIQAVVTRTFPLEEAEAAHRLIRETALVGRAALILQ
jgi:D-arabinose 1-dehydrogenase-like Zn-dependent alcohol dehydrogenase